MAHAASKQHSLPAVTLEVPANGQMRVPRQVRQALALHPGDMVQWQTLPGGIVQLRRAAPNDVDYLRSLEATLGEWGDDLDAAAYDNL